MISQMTPAGLQAGETGEIDRTLRLSGPHEDPALLGADGKDVAGTDQILRFCVVGHGGQNRRRAVRRRDPRRDPLFGLDGDREGGSEAGTVVPDHRHQAELVRIFLGQGEADQPPSVAGHEIDRLRRDELGRHAEVSFVFPILVVDEDDHLAAFDIDNGFLDGADTHVSSLPIL